MKLLPVILLAALPLSQGAYANLSGVPSLDEDKYSFVKDVAPVTEVSSAGAATDSGYLLFKDVAPRNTATDQVAGIADTVSILKDEFIENL